ncbi:MAG TPA: DnaA/Hda family protein [Burkholderiaceae bacterium]|nr:DnaA/Hda family protein [Burkholderiaceae bacterium]
MNEVSRQLALDLLQPLEPSLDNFVPGRNAEALAALRRLADGSGADRSIYLWGVAGSGRTHLLRALAALGAMWHPVTPPDAPGLSIVDDVETLDDEAQIALFTRLNAVRAHAACRCLAAGSLPPAQLALREDVRTRLAWGLVYQLQPLSDAEKMQALAAHAASRGVRADPEVFAWLLHHLPRDMRTLVAALDALDAAALARKKALTVALAKELARTETGSNP